MIENGVYFAKNDFYNIIKNCGGAWNDSKERPIICMIKSIEDPRLYWAIPLGNFDHRDQKAKARIKNYMARREEDIASCYYHIANTDVTSIFFISDVIPITDKYIDREYLGKYTNRIYIVKNKIAIKEINRKLNRILSFEKATPNYFRQHITDVKEYLLKELGN